MQLELAEDNEVWEFLKDLNWSVNKDIGYRSDMELYDRIDFWDIVEEEGDCDDYALTKRKMLREKYPEHKDCFLLALCMVQEGNTPARPYRYMSKECPGEHMWDQHGTYVKIGNDMGGHAVLIVVTDKGDFVLDNRHNDVLLWNKAW